MSGPLLGPDKGMLLPESLSLWREGDDGAAREVGDLLHQRLHQIPVGRMQREQRQPTMQPTALVHEVVIRLLVDAPRFNSPEHLFTLASRMMRNFLINEAKRRSAQRNGGQAVHVTRNSESIGGNDPGLDVLDLEQALAERESSDERKARIIELHYFEGLSYAEMATVLEISRATVHRELSFACAFISSRLGGEFA